MRADRIIQARQASHLIEVETMHEAAVIDYDKRIVDQLRRRMGLVDADRMSVSAQQVEYARAVAIQRPGVVNHDLQGVAPAREQKAPQHFATPGGVVFPSQRVIEYADLVPRSLQDRVDRRFVFGIAEDLCVLWFGFACH